MEEKLFKWLKTFSDKFLDKLITNKWLLIVTMSALALFMEITAFNSMFYSILGVGVTFMALIALTEIEYGIEYKYNSAVETIIKKPRENWINAFLIGFFGLGLNILLTWVITGNSFQLSHEASKLSQGAIISTIAIAPIMEELIFRQTLYHDLLKPKMNKWLAFVIAVLVFTLFHIPKTPILFLQYLISSTSLYFVYDKSKDDVRASILFHMLNNIIAIL